MKTKHPRFGSTKKYFGNIDFEEVFRFGKLFVVINGTIFFFLRLLVLLNMIIYRNRYPVKYNLHLFQSFGSVTWDHSDPSIHTVLSAPADDHGNNACDVVAFTPRWDAATHTFRPPW
jgi:homogentisate 1,2-dioxygenase